MNYVYTIQDPQLQTIFPSFAKNLFAMNASGLEMINGFVISNLIVKDLTQSLKLEDLWIESLARLDVARMQANDLDKFSSESYKRIAQYQFSDEFKEEISKAYSNISGFLDSGVSIYNIVNDQEVVVRDLNIKGIDEILNSIKKIVANELISDKVLERYRLSLPVFDLNSSFLVLKSIQPEVSGFAYNFELINNLKEKYTVEAIFGLISLLENKNVIPDQYIWDLETGRVVEKFLSKQAEMEILITSKEKSKIIPISKTWQDKQKLDDRYIEKLVEKLKLLDNEFSGRLFRLKWAFESGKLYGLGIEEFNSKSEHKILESVKKIELPLIENIDNNVAKLTTQTQVISDEVFVPKEVKNINSSFQEKQNPNIFDKLLGKLNTNSREVKTNNQTIFENFDETKIENATVEEKVNEFETNQITQMAKKDKYEGKTAFEILYPQKTKQSISNSKSNIINSQTITNVSYGNVNVNTSNLNQNTQNNHALNLNNRISDMNLKHNVSSMVQVSASVLDLNKNNQTEIKVQNQAEKVKLTKTIVSNDSVENKTIPSLNLGNKDEIKKIEVDEQKHEELVEKTQKKITGNIKTATKVYLNLHGESNLNTSDILSSDGAIIEFDHKNLDIEGLSVVLSNNSQLYNPKPVIYQLGGLNKYTKYNEELPLEVEKQFSSVLTARNLEGNKNLHVMINTIKTSDEYLNIKKFITTLGLRRSANFKVYLSLENLAAFHNLQAILEDGVDGIFINLDELSRFAVGNTNTNDVFQIYDIETIGILNLLRDAVSFCSKAKVPVFVNISTLAGEKLEYNLKKILQLGIYGVQTSRSNLVNVKEILSKLELENLFK